jgi:transcriptional regulator with XRE-family HTH domain
MSDLFSRIQAAIHLNQDESVMTTAIETPTWAKRLLDLRKARKWSQPELAQHIGTSGPVIGRYERAEMTPSIEVARKFAKVFDVTLDYLFNEGDLPAALQDKKIIERWEALNDIPEEDKNHIEYLIDGLIRDAKARQTYGR